MSDTFILRRKKSEILEQKSTSAISISLMWTIYFNTVCSDFKRRMRVIFSSRNSNIHIVWTTRYLTLSVTWIAFTQLINWLIFYYIFLSSSPMETQKQIWEVFSVFHHLCSNFEGSRHLRSIYLLGLGVSLTVEILRFD